MDNFWKKNLLLLLCTISFQLLYAQENCTNGVDDDGDGFIDCYDNECSGGPSCTDFYFGNSVLCADEPTANPTFSIRTEWTSADETANSHATPTVGDIDQDGTPEVVVTNRQARTATVLDGVTGATEFQINLGFEPENGLVLANLQGDGCAEMIFVENLGNEIEVYDCTGTLVWSGTSTRQNIGLPSVADFDGDGNAELYYKNEIRNALTGAILVTGSGNWDRDFVHGPIAIDIVGDSRLELITGDNIWDVNLTTGTLTSVRDMDVDLATSGYTGSYHPKYYSSWDDQWSAISVADFNLDGNIDVLTSGALGGNYNGHTSVFFWDVTNGTVAVYQDVNFARGTGRINIADVDGDGQPNATFIMDQILYSLELDGVTGNLVETWKIGVKEGSSGFTGCSLFDFDGDGAFETVYRSEQALLIIDGKTETIRQSLPCISRTQEEYPIVADIDGDGASEICVTCYTSDLTPFNPYSNTQFAHVRVFGADGGEVWQPSRSVWNQHGYFNVNINDDLTIPISQQDPTQIFSTDVCTVGPNRVLNTFLNQSPFVDADGCPSYVSPDIDLAGDSQITPTNSTCPNTEFEVSFQIANTGDADINGLLPVSFYAGDPTTTSSTYLNTQNYVLNNFNVGDTETIVMTVEGIGGDFDLYIVVNNSGQQPPIVLNSAGLPECDFGNNIDWGAVTYDVFPLTVNKISDNQKCDPTKPNNGTAEAYFDGMSGGQFENIWFEDFDNLTNGTQNDNSDDSQWSSTPSGTPSFYGVNTRSGNKGFRVWNTGGPNEANPLTWTSELIDISGHTDIAISADMFADGAMEASGQWRDVMRVYYSLDGGPNVLMQEGFGNFGYSTANATGLNGNDLRIIATFHSTADNEQFTLDNVDISGTSALVNKQWTDADGYEFYWYPVGDFSTLLHNGSTYSTMDAGTYSVVGYAPESNCYSDTATVTINTVSPTYFVELFEVSPLTDCAAPNGVLSAFAYTQTNGLGDPLDTLTEADGISFTWVITSEGSTPIGTGDTLSGLEAIEYDVSIVHDPSGCTASSQPLRVSTSFVSPDPADINITPTHVTTCNGTGSLAADVNGTTAGYDFLWYIGSGVGTSPDFTTSTITGITPGFYTVRVRDQSSSCTSDEVVVELLDNSNAPDPQLVINSHNTACDSTGYTGSVTATVSQGGVSMTWYKGTTTSNANKLPGSAVPSATVSASGNSSTLSNLPDGIYSVEAKKGGCTVKRTVEILDNSSAPTFNGTSQVNAGSAILFSDKSWIEMPQGIDNWTEVTVSYWAYITPNNYANDNVIFATAANGSQGSTLNLWTSDTYGIAFQVDAGGGSVGVIYSNYKPTGWVQLTGVWSLADLDGDGLAGDMAVYADGVLVGTDNYVGDGGGIQNSGAEMFIARDANLGTNKFDGRLDEFRLYNKAFLPSDIQTNVCADVTGAESDLIIYYDFDGLTDTNNGAVIPNRASSVNTESVVANGQSGAYFDGTARRQAQGTFSYLTSNINCPIGLATPNTACDPTTPNGEVDMTDRVDPIGGDYTYIFYDGYATDDTLSVQTSPILTGLTSGFYAVEAVDNIGGCSTGPLTFSIADVPDLPTVNITVTDDIGCSTPGLGELFVQTYSDTSEPASYSFQLYDGAAFTTPIGSPVTVNNGTTGHTFTGLTEGTYRVQVTNDDTDCEFSEDAIITDVSVVPTFQSISKFNNGNCGALSNGVISAQMAGGNSNYTFRWYEGSTVASPLLTDSVSNEIGGLNATGASTGTYTVVAVNNVTGCETLPQTRTIIDAPTYPDVTVFEVQAQSGCGTGAGADGIADAFVTTTATGNDSLREESNYNFQWFDDTMTPIDATSLTTSGLAAGILYTVRVTDNTTGCFTDETITISQNPIQPVLALNASSNNTSCDPTTYDGAISLDLTFDGSPVASPAANGYDFDWFYSSGTQVADGAPVSGSTTESVSGLIGDTYEVVAHAPNGCSSDTLVVTISDTPILPDFVTGPLVNNAVCDPVLVTTGSGYNGSVQVDVNDGSPIGNYTINWYDGAGTGTPAAVGTINGNRYEDLPGGTYTAEVINTAGNLCDTTIQMTITNDLTANISDDAPGVTPTNNTSCVGAADYPNGTLTISSVFPDGSGDYTFNYYIGSSVTATPDDSNTTGVFTDLAASQYTIDVIDNVTGCTSLPTTVSIIDAPILPDFVTGPTVDNTICDPALAINAGGTYNGSVQVDVNDGSPIGDYTITWYDGAGTGTPAAVGTVSGNLYEELPGGTYTAEIINTTGNQCDTTIQLTIIDDLTSNIEDEAPAVTPTDVTNCAPATPNGTLDASATGFVDGSGDYTWNFYIGNSVTASPDETNTTGTWSPLAASEYTVEVIDNMTGCISLPTTVSIIDAPILPDFVTGPTVDNTICDPALAINAGGTYNGSVQVDVNDGSPIGNYTITWYDGAGTGTPAAVGTVSGNLYEELPGGTYTAEIINTAGNQCDTTIQLTIIDDLTTNIEDEAPAVTPTDVTNCAPAAPNGTLDASATGFVDGSGDYTWNFYIGNSVTASPDETNTTGTWSPLAASEYTVEVIDNMTGCISLPTTVTINDDPILPDFIEGPLVNNTICDATLATSAGGAFNGSVQVDVNDGSPLGDYTITWYDGGGTGTPATVGTVNGNRYEDLPGGTYTAEIIRTTGNQCDTTIQMTIIDDLTANIADETPVVTPTNNTMCAGGIDYPNGIVDASAPAFSADGSGDYTWNFYIGSSVKLIADETNITGTWSGRGAGDYTVQVVDNVSGCTSLPATVSIIDAPIAITVAGESITHFTNCSVDAGAPDPNGEIDLTGAVSMASPPEPASYSYQWYFGSGTAEPLDATDLVDGDALNGETTAHVVGLEPGTYTVEVTNDDTQCSETFEFEIEDQTVTPVITAGSVVANGNVNCTGTPTGEVDATGALAPAAGAGVTYTYELLDATNTPIFTEDTGGGADGIFDELPAGNYKVRATINETGCISNIVPVNVADDTQAPALSASVTNNETFCSTPNGEISFSTADATPAANWDVNVFAGTGTGGTNVYNDLNSGLSAWVTPDTLSAGTYTVQLLNNDTGCDSLMQVSVALALIEPSIVTGDVVKTNNTLCVNSNGTITINAVTNGGGAPTYTIYPGSSTAGTPDSTSTDNVFENLPAGTYTVTATNNISGCESNGITRTITNTPVAVTANIVKDSDQTACDLTDPNGQLTANPTAPTALPANFTFEWFQGFNTNNANAIPANAVTGAVLSGTNNQTVAGLPAGNYRVRVTDIQSGCVTTVDATIIVDTTNPTVSGLPSTVDNTSCSTPDGEISITINDASAAINDGANGYTFELYTGTIGAGETPLQTISNTNPSPTTQVFTGLLDGDYTIQAVDNNTSCKVVSSLVTVGYGGMSIVFDEPSFDKGAISTCFTNDGYIDVTNTGGVTFIDGDADITWYIGTDTSNTANTVLNQVGGATFFDDTDVNTTGFTITNYRVENLPAVVYTGVVTYANGCKDLIQTDLSQAGSPTLALINVTDPTRCAAAFDGSFDIQITANSGNSPDQYTYYIFEGNRSILNDADGASPYSPSLGGGTYNPVYATATFTSAVADDTEVVSINGLDSGVYTVGIEINFDQCITNVQTVTLNAPVQPNLTLDVAATNDNQVCNVSGALRYDGTITVDASHPDGGTFDFQWYYDSDGDGDFTTGQTATMDVDGGAGAGSFPSGSTTNNTNTAVISGLGAGWYRVIAIHNNNGVPPGTACPDTLDIELFDDPLPLAFDPGVVTTTDVLDCDGTPDNDAEFGTYSFPTIEEDGVALGAATVDGNFDIVWEYDPGQDGTFEISPYAPSVDQNDADQLLPGDYRLNIESLTSGCTDSYEFTIDDLRENPIIDLVASADNTDCDGGTNDPTGSIQIQVVDAGGGVIAAGEYTYQWYFGSGTGNTLDAGDLSDGDALAGETTNTVSGLEGGTYTVEVTDNSDVTNENESCVATATFTIADDRAEVAIQTTVGTDYDIEHQENCNPNEDGRIEILRVIQDGTPAAVGGYTFNWYENDMVTPLAGGLISGANNEIASTLPADTYYVEAVNTTTDCISDLVAITVQDKTVIPNVQIVQTAPDTSCDDDAIANSKVGTGDVTASVILPGGGTAPAANYNYLWYEGSSAVGGKELNPAQGAAVIASGYSLNGDENVVSDLPEGTYYVEVTDPSDPGLGCIGSEVITVTQFNPVISIGALGVDYTVQNDENCLDDNGSITILAVNETLPGGGTSSFAPGNYTLRWYTVPTGGPAFAQTGAFFDNSGAGLSAGTYYVEAQRTSSECIASTRKAINVVQETVNPVVQASATSSDRFCSDGATFSGNGTLDIGITEEGVSVDTTEYTITWYRGNSTAGGDEIFPDDGGDRGATAAANGSYTELSGLTAGQYTVVVEKEAIDPNAGCSVTTTFTVGSNPSKMTIPNVVSNVLIEPNTNCAPPTSNYDGSIEILNVVENGTPVATDIGPYTFQWFKDPNGVNTNVTADAGPGPNVAGTNNYLSGQEGETYAAVVTNTVTGCVSARIEFVINNDRENPVVQTTSKTSDRFCSDGGTFAGNGSLNISVTEEGAGANLANYSVTWYRGSTAGVDEIFPIDGGNRGTTAVSAAPYTSLSGLSAGTYTVVARKNDGADPNAGCSVTQTITIGSNPNTITIPNTALNVAIDPNTNCAPPTTNYNGRIEILRIVENGTPIDVTAGNYTFVWAKDPQGANTVVVGVPGDTEAGINNQIEGQEGETYGVTVTNNLTGCISSEFEFVIPNDRQNPVVQSTSKTSDRYCDDQGTFAGSGTLNISVTEEGVAANLVNYSITWYRGSSAVPANEIFPADAGQLGSTAAFAGSGTNLTGLEAGTYTVVADKNDGASPNAGCSVTQTFTIGSNPLTMTVPDVIANVEVIDNENCDPPANFTGSIEILRVLENGTANAASGPYTFQWFDGGGTDITASAVPGLTEAGAGNRIENLEGDTYTVIVTNTNTGCTTASLPFTVVNDRENPVAQATTKTNDTFCDDLGTFAGNGTLNISVTEEGAAATLADYSITWYRGSSVVAANEIFPADAGQLGSTASPNGTGTAWTGLTAGTYSVVAAKNNGATPNAGCSVTQTFTIGSSPVNVTVPEVLANIEVIDNDNCTPFNGSIEVLRVLENGNPTNVSLGNYTFEWFDGGGNDITGTAVAGVTEAGVGNRIELLEGDTYSYRVTNNDNGCASALIQVEVANDQVNPVINLASKTASTFCNPAANTGNGSLNVNLLEEGAAAIVGDYTLTWYRGTTVSAANQIFPADGGTRGTANNASGDLTGLDGLGSGLYTLVINKVGGSPNDGCVAQRTFEVLLNETYPTINIPDTQITPNTTCFVPGNGAIQLDANDIVVGGVTQTDLANFTWTITAAGGSSISGNASPYSPALAGATTTFTDLSPDTYTIMATTLAGCATSIDVEILDESVPPIIDSLNMVPNTNCSGGGNALGSIEILVVNGNPAGNGDYTFSWTDGGGAPVVGNEILANVQEDTYTVTVTETATNCTFTQAVDITNDPDFPIIVAGSTKRNFLCTTPGSGGYSLEQVRYQGVDYFLNNSVDSLFLANNFTVAFFESDGSTVMADPVPATPFRMDSLGAGTYFASITHNASNCGSQLVQFDVVDDLLFPDINIVTLQADSTCNVAATANGMLQVIPDNISIDSLYNYEWYAVDGAGNRTGGILTTDDTLANRSAGRYEVEVTSVLSGCSSIGQISIRSVPQEILILNIDSVSATTCSPSDAFIEVTQMNVGTLADFTFAFYNGDTTAANPNGVLLQDGASPLLSATGTPAFDVIPDTYYVVATRTSTGCVSDPYEITIEDNTTPPTINLVSFRENQNCDPGNTNGFIEVSANGSQDGTLYDFEWRDSGGNVVQPDSIAAVGLGADTYSVTVTDLTTMCVNTRSFTLDEDPLSPIPLVTSVGGNTNCINPNGSAAASVNVSQAELADRGKGLADFTFHWYNGRQVYDDYQNNGTTPNTGAADFTGTLYSGLDGDNFYSVFVTDATDAFCNGMALAFVPDDSRAPDFRVDIINNVTICYPNMADGRATIGYSAKPLSQYRFDWYAGTDTTSAPIADSNVSTNFTSLDSLDIGVYTVVATDVITGCVGVRQFNVMDATVPPTTPSMTVVANRTNCLVPNGSAIARVDGQATGYSFEWYEESDPNTLFNTGSQVNNLDTTTYLVRATNVRTGCESAFGRVTITNAITDPEFIIDVTNSLCVRDESGSSIQHSGSAVVLFDGVTEVDSIVWYDPDGNILLAAGSNQRLIEAAPGIGYSVWFRAANGCDYFQEFNISTQLSIYNGVSANDDGRNEYFRVDCIEFFPNNRVSIYNRDGSLVWEVNGYENFTEGMRFRGFSNVGRQGLELPVGTYFYFIDKGDGSDVIQGYLELVR